MRQIILASVSPRRKEIFKSFGIKFKAIDSGYEEILQKHLTHEQQVVFLAVGKAKAAAKKFPKAIIVSADTMVLFGSKIIGKPKNIKDAEKMLRSFSGKTQIIMTGVAVLDAQTGQVLTHVEKSSLLFKKLTKADIAEYIKHGKPLDKAGGYNLQGYGFNLIQKIDGDFTNNLGLPMGVVYNFLQQLGIKIN
ncbi:MAG: Maf family protein [Patescibacteria group bacterium]